ncbi:MAG TPA: hypothetical protein VMU04_15625, partial [Candidatus Acidoferrum sp.]|nr:hypothetical protein [Candidatus Acidoferrum sp.]
ISFILNEAADNVGLSFPDNHSTNNLGPLAPGVHSFTLGPGTNAYVIYVSKAGSGLPNQISPTPVGAGGTPGGTNCAYFGPRGVAVNQNPKGHNFGRIYVVNASAGTFVRHVDRGLYVINADFSDTLGYGNTGSPPQANFPSSGSQWWGSSTTYSPWRAYVGPDDTVYVGDSAGMNSATSTTAGEPVWMMDPDLTTPIEMFTYGTAANSVNAGGAQSKPFVTGSLGQNNLVLTCFMWNYQAPGGQYPSLLQYNIGGGPIDSSTVWTAVPTVLVANPWAGVGNFDGLACDLYLNPTNGYIYATAPRSNAGGQAQGNTDLLVYDSTGNLLWASSAPGQGGVGTYGTNDCFIAQTINLAGVAISPDGQYLAAGNSAAANFVLVKLTNGIPDPSTIAKYTAPGVINRSVAFDLAENLYTVEGNSDSLRCYSLGFTTTCVTSNDASANNGSFWIVLPSTTVSVTATTPNASQGNPTPVPGVFTLTRAGQLTSPLYATFSFSGTASNSTYTVSGAGPDGTNVTFAVGQSTTNITITPVNDGIARPTTSVTLSLSGGTNYSAVAPLQATILIQNTAEPQLVLSAAASTAYKRYTNDYTSLTITRLGNTNVSLPISTLTFGGTAVQGTDYALYSAPTMPAGTITTNFNVFRPLNPPEAAWAGNKSVVVTLGANGSTYTNTPGQNSQTLIILDDKYPAAPVLWSDPLTSSLDQNNSDGSGSWNLTAVNRDGTDPVLGGDFTVDWGYDLVNDPNGYGHIPLPPTGLANSLRVTYNKVHGVSGAVNLYPTNVSFSGDYAVRFQMYLAQGGESGAVGGSTATEGALFGIDHDGMETNWWGGSTPIVGGPWTSDGVWYWLDADPGGSAQGDYIPFTGIANTIPNTGWAHPNAALFGSTSFPNVFKDPQIFTTVGITTNPISGLPANASWAVVPTNNANWADVEIKQIKNTVTLSINKTVIFQYANTNSLLQQGTLMLGYEDPYDSRGDLDAAAFYSNVQVVRLSTLQITSFALSGPNVVLQFTSPDGSVALQSCGTVNGTYTDVSPAATITQDPVSDIFQIVYPQSGGAQFYRLRHM